MLKMEKSLKKVVTSSELYPRSLTNNLKEAMKDTPVICFLGPRQCGKSTLAQTCCTEYAYINLDEEDVLLAALNDPSGFFLNPLLNEMSKMLLK